MDFVIDVEHLRQLLGAAKCDCWWEDNSGGFGITFSRLLQLISESQRKSQEHWQTESDDWIQIALMRLGILRPLDDTNYYCGFCRDYHKYSELTHWKHKEKGLDFWGCPKNPVYTIFKRSC